MNLRTWENGRLCASLPSFTGRMGGSMRLIVPLIPTREAYTGSGTYPPWYQGGYAGGTPTMVPGRLCRRHTLHIHQGGYVGGIPCIYTTWVYTTLCTTRVYHQDIHHSMYHPGIPPGYTPPYVHPGTPTQHVCRTGCQRSTDRGV